MNIGSQIKKIRVLKKLKQEDLADAADISRVMLGKYERNQAIPSSEVLQKLAEALGVMADELLSNEITKEIMDKDLKKYFEAIDGMSEEEKNHVKYFLDAVVTKHCKKTGFND